MLRIDFGRRRALLPILRWLLAGCALAAGAASIQRHLDYREQAARWELAQDAEAAPLEEPAPDAPDELAARLRQADAARASVAVPWARLFETLEAVPAQDVALLNLGADAAAGTLTIEAEARSVAAMHAYLGALGDTGYLERVHLVSEQGAGQAGKPGVRFVALAHWAALGARVAEANR
jgi:Tfp pilus assembly protein PilN